MDGYWSRPVDVQLLGSRSQDVFKLVRVKAVRDSPS